jgi:quinol monooxygenase YgiN
MAVRIFVTFRAKPGKGSELVQARLPRHAVVRNDPGCEQFDLYQNVENPDEILLVERWKDQESLDAHYALNRPQIGVDLREGGGKNETYIVD